MGKILQNVSLGNTFFPGDEVPVSDDNLGSYNIAKENAITGDILLRNSEHLWGKGEENFVHLTLIPRLNTFSQGKTEWKIRNAQ